jgi:SAM-dependent methyltransferase
MIDRKLNYGRHHIRGFLERARPFARVLDLGAGGGRDLALAAEVNPSVQRIAGEVYAPYVEGLRAQGIEVISLDIEKELLPFSSGDVDVIIANQVLEHTKDIFWIFHEISRVLPVGGKIIIGVPNLASFHNRVLLAVGRQPSPIKSASAHVRGFTRHDLLHFMDASFP